MSLINSLTDMELEDYASRVLVQLEPVLAQPTLSVIQELMGYRANLKEGKIIKLPCKIGSTIFMLITKSPKYGFPKYTFIKTTKLTYYNLEKVLKEFGKTVFLTKAKANQKLKEIKEKQNG